MNTEGKIERRANAIALGRWENEGGAPDHDSMDIQYGRRVESDRSWTVYHVFNGVPARADGHAMSGMSRSDATKGMMSFNLINTGRRRERTRLSELARETRETPGGQS
nr:hypothetical protein [Rhizobium sp. P32RR-XVIII]